MTTFLVDLDGTVYDSNKEPYWTVSWLRLERAVMELYGRKLDFDWKSKAGGTEKGVAEAVIRGLGSGLIARMD